MNEIYVYGRVVENYRVIPLPVVLQASKIVQIHNITKKPAKMYVLSLYNFDAYKKNSSGIYL
jgi:hypothetical protein